MVHGEDDTLKSDEESEGMERLQAREIIEKNWKKMGKRETGRGVLLSAMLSFASRKF